MGGRLQGTTLFRHQKKMASLAAMASGAGPVSSSCSDAQDGGVLNPPRWCVVIGCQRVSPA